MKSEVKILVDTSDGLHYEMSVEDARELRDLLVEALGEKKEAIPCSTPYTPINYPAIWEEQKKYASPYPTITCSDYKNYLDTQY